ncbi:MAG: type 4a pilus biogenesis protein PilO [Bdellovibrionaceae bacterium]|nr:type 4a pilus biogenesis protein PilO [Pseudobdellovibrionaceae bacterium]
MNQVFQKLVNYSVAQVAAFGLILGLGYYFFLYDDGSALEAQIASLQGEITREEEKKKETDATLQEEARIKDAVGSLSQQYQEISRRLPNSLSSIELNRHIDSFARNSGASIKARQPMPNTAMEIVEEVPVKITLEGNYGELAEFVYQVALSERVTAMQAFTISNIERSTRLRLEGTVIGYQLAPEKPAAVDPNAPPGGPQ